VHRTVSDELRLRIREHFPALAGDTVFLENAGGSQVPATVADAVRAYMLSSYVQLGAGYPLSQRASALVDEAHGFVRTLMNGDGGTVILGPSTSALLRALAACYAEALGPGRAVVVAETGHEANVGPWVWLERAGVELRWWRMQPSTFSCPLEALDELLDERVALVALPHVSNLLGEIVDVAAVADRAHRVGARVVVDGVAFAPHRAMDVAAWGVDWYAYSTYKVYGPHMAALWGRREALAELRGPNHFFIPEDELPYKFELGGVNHEGCAGILGLRDYLGFLAGGGSSGRFDRAAVESAFALMTACELPLQARLLDHLRSRADVTVVGPPGAGPERVGTVSFVHRSLSSAAITRACDRAGIAIRHGHMYAYRLCQAAGLDPADGVVRVSLVHYNTPEEIERLIDVLDRAMGD
jgi:cysteine desulfurase family protein (TIGR01976 family)